MEVNKIEPQTGIERISLERWEQMFKHGRTIESDQVWTENQLTEAASYLMVENPEMIHCDEPEEYAPQGWDTDLWTKMMSKSYPERLVIAGALIAAEIDRIQNIKK